MDVEELKRRYVAGERYFISASLVKAKLIDAYLPGINLWG
ncbi:MAG: pentapeptide repeat-containing protein, partial [Cuspidothrix sp.]